MNRKVFSTAKLPANVRAAIAQARPPMSYIPHIGGGNCREFPAARQESQ